MARSKTTSRSDRRPLAPEAEAELAPEAERTCFECGGPMELGFVPDSTQGGTARHMWVEGTFKRSAWTGYKKKGRRHFYVDTFRCARCGALRAYALEPKA